MNRPVLFDFSVGARDLPNGRRMADLSARLSAVAFGRPFVSSSGGKGAQETPVHVEEGMTNSGLISYRATMYNVQLPHPFLVVRIATPSSAPLSSLALSFFRCPLFLLLEIAQNSSSGGDHATIRGSDHMMEAHSESATMTHSVIYCHLLALYPHICSSPSRLLSPPPFSSPPSVLC